MTPRQPHFFSHFVLLRYILFVLVLETEGGLEMFE